MNTLDSIVQGLPLEERIGHLLMVPPVERIMRRVHAGTVIVMDYHLLPEIDHAAEFTTNLQSAAAQYTDIPVWVHGFVLEKDWAGPRDGEIAKQCSEQEAEALAYELGRRWREVGFHNYPSPTVNVPLFETGIALGEEISRDPAVTTLYARALTRGLHRAGCGNMAQHFPAHGATAVDSHKDVPVVKLNRDDIMRDHIAPYVASFAEGCSTICTAHLRCPALDPHPTDIATISKSIMTDLLRSELGFKGIAIADCVSMAAYQRMGDLAATTVKAVAAGCDSICITLEDDTAAHLFDGLLAAVQDGRLDASRVDEAVRRNLEFKAWLGLLPDATS